MHWKQELIWKILRYLRIGRKRWKWTYRIGTNGKIVWIRRKRQFFQGHLEEIKRDCMQEELMKKVKDWKFMTFFCENWWIVRNDPKSRVFPRDGDISSRIRALRRRRKFLRLLAAAKQESFGRVGKILSLLAGFGSN